MIASYETRINAISISDRTNGTSKLKCTPHLHRDIELALLLEGSTVGHADSEATTFESGDAFLVFPNQVHYFESFGTERYYLLIINPDNLPGLADVFRDMLPASGCIKGAAKDPEILRLAERLVSLRKSENPFEQKASIGYLVALFGQLLSKLTFHKAAPDDSRALKAVLNYCIKNYADDLSLSVLEEQLHISKYYISHLFSDKLRIGFNDYINSLRISYACRYLQNTDKSVIEISELVGFGTPRTFNRAFSKQMGCTPSEFRHSVPSERPPIHNKKKDH